jgi:hypothetical protein
MAVAGGVTPTIASQAFPEANKWLTGQMPQDLEVMLGIS